jgi:hypothetical protein
MSTKQYNRLFLDALRALITAGPETADEALITFLSSQRAESQFWPDDASLRQAIVDLPVYNLLTRGRVRMVLEAFEDDLRSPKTEDQFVTRNALTVEHVMPQSWQRDWPLPAGAEPMRAELDRNRLIHTFGNLTLATFSLNTVMSNHSWAEKREHLQEHSILRLTKGILDRAAVSGGWSDELIRERSEQLYQRAKVIWPHP